MIEITGTEHSEVLEATTTGTATEDDMQQFKAALQKKTQQQEPVNLLLVFKNIEGITLKGWIEDVKITSFIKSVEKVAILADDTFAGADKDLLSSLIPGVEIKQYPLGELETARNWLG